MPNHPSRPQVVAFDVIETLFSLEPMRPRLQSVGLAPGSLERWFATVLRDAFALAATDAYAPFEKIASGTLQELIAEAGRAPQPGEVQDVMAGMKELSAHPDVKAAFVLLRDAGVRIAALSNGSAEQTRHLLGQAGLGELVEKVISTDEVQLFKPRREVYLHAARQMNVEPRRMALVAAHGWDTHGAKNAGLVAGWVERKEKRLSDAMQGPDIGGKTLDDVARGLLALPEPSNG